MRGVAGTTGRYFQPVGMACGETHDTTQARSFANIKRLPAFKFERPS